MWRLLFQSLSGSCVTFEHHRTFGRETRQLETALVLAADHSAVEYGKNLVGVLDYRSPQKPTIEFYRERKWLAWNNEIDLAWYHYMGFRAVKNRLEVVGQVEILESDPSDSNVYRHWSRIW